MRCRALSPSLRNLRSAYCASILSKTTDFLGRFWRSSCLGKWILGAEAFPVWWHTGKWPCQCHYFSSGDSGRIYTARSAEIQLTTKLSQLVTFPRQSCRLEECTRASEGGLSLDISHTSLTPVFLGLSFLSYEITTLPSLKSHIKM